MAKKTVRPLPGYVVLKKHELETNTGNLVLADDAKERPSVGEVVAVGQSSLEDIYKFSEVDKSALTARFDLLVSNLVKEGNIVAYQNYGGQELTVDGEEFILVPFDKLLGVVE